MPGSARKLRCEVRHERHGRWTVRRDLERRLARAEEAASATNWADWSAAHYRKQLRTRVTVCNLIRERFLSVRLDPALAAGLRLGDEAAAELAAIPDSDALRTADEAITRTRESNSEARPSFEAKIERMAEHYLDGSQPDFAKASVAQLLAFCVAIEKLAWG